MWTCPQCSRINDERARFCGSCGSKRPVSDASAARFCPECGAPVFEGSAFCMSCGRSLSDSGSGEDKGKNVKKTRAEKKRREKKPGRERKPRGEKKGTGHRGRKILIWSIVALAVLALAAFYILHTVLNTKAAAIEGYSHDELAQAADDADLQISELVEAIYTYNSANEELEEILDYADFDGLSSEDD